MSETPRRLLLCYDGSPEAAHAIAEAGRLFGGGRATVVYAWQTAAETAARVGVLPSYVPPDDYERDRESARQVAKDGAELARQAGFDADAQIVESVAASWAAILVTADQLDVDLVVVGARGLTGARSFLLGSVSHHVVNLTRRKTLVVPSAQLVADREVAVPEVDIRLEAA